MSVFDKIDNTEREKRWQQQKEGLKTEETVAESGRIFIRYLFMVFKAKNFINYFLFYHLKFIGTYLTPSLRKILKTCSNLLGLLQKLTYQLIK